MVASVPPIHLYTYTPLDREIPPGTQNPVCCSSIAGTMLERCWNDAGTMLRLPCSSIVRQEGCHIVGGLDLLLESVSLGGSSSSAPCVETMAKVRQSRRRRFQICLEYRMQQCVQTTLRACLIDDLWEIKYLHNLATRTPSGPREGYLLVPELSLIHI